MNRLLHQRWSALGLALLFGAVARADHPPMQGVIAYGLFPVLGDSPYDKDSLEGKIVTLYRLTEMGEPLLAEQIYRSLPPAQGDPVAEAYAILARERLDRYGTQWIGGGYKDDSPWSGHPSLHIDPIVNAYKATDDLIAQSQGGIQNELKWGISFQSQCEMWSDNEKTLAGNFYDKPQDPANLAQLQQSVQQIESYFGPLINGIEVTSLDGEQSRTIQDWLLSKTFQSAGDFVHAAQAIADGQQLAQGAANSSAQVVWDMALGDLNLSPTGDVVTLGYDIDNEASVRQTLSRGEPSFAVRASTPDQIQRGTTAYLEAGTLLHDGSDATLTLELKLRLAHCQRVTVVDGMPSTIEMYKKAAEVAAADGYTIQAARIQCVAAILEGNADLFHNEMDALYQGKDLSGYYSEVELAISWAYRLQYGFNRPQAAMKVVDMTVDDLLKNRALNEGVKDKTMTYLGDMYSYFGQSDAAVATYDTLADDLKARINAAGQSQSDNPQDDAARLKLLWAKLESILFYLQALALQDHGSQPGASDKNLQEIAVAAQHTGVGAGILPGSPAYLGMEFHSQVRKLVLEFDNLSSFEGRYHSLRAQAAARGVPDYSLALGDAEASVKSPNIYRETQAALAQLKPVDVVQASLDHQYFAADVFKRSGDIRLAVQQSLLCLDLADRFKCTDLVTDWSQQLKEEAAKEPLIAQMTLTVPEFYSARALTRQGKGAQAAAIFNNILTKAPWTPVSAASKLSCLQSLCDAQIAQGDYLSSVTSYIWWREESDYWEMFRRRLDFSAKSSAQTADVYFDAATSGQPISNDDLARLRGLSGNFDDVAKPEPSRPETTDVQKWIDRQSPRTEIIVYRWTNDGLDRWVLRKGSAPKLYQVPISSSELTDRIDKFTKDAPGNAANWQTLGSDLNELLFEGLGNFEGVDTVAILAPGIISDLPLDLLAASMDNFRGRAAAVVKLSSFLPEADAATIDAAPDSTNLVVAYGGELNSGEQEAGEIASQFRVTPVLNKDDFLKAVPTAKYLHVVCHGEILPNNPFESYLQMGGEPVEAWRLFATAPGARLIVLSACDTAVRHGQDTPGETDTLSLAAMAQAGGGQYLISTLWEVDDEASTEIMKDFYTGLQAPQASIPQSMHHALVSYSRDHLDALPWRFAGFTLSARDIGCLPGQTGP